jgi:Zn-dependent protease
VPVDPRNLRHPLRDMMLVALAGPATNVVLAAVFMILWKASFVHWGYDPEELMPRVLMRGSFLNLALAVFNMLPIPPLDGGRVVTGLLPRPYAWQFAQIERYGLVILLGLLFLVPYVAQSLGYAFNPLEYVLLPPVEWVYTLILSLAGFA